MGPPAAGTPARPWNCPGGCNSGRVGGQDGTRALHSARPRPRNERLGAPSRRRWFWRVIRGSRWSQAGPEDGHVLLSEHWQVFWRGVQSPEWLNPGPSAAQLSSAPFLRPETGTVQGLRRQRGASGVRPPLKETRLVGETQLPRSYNECGGFYERGRPDGCGGPGLAAHPA